MYISLVTIWTLFNQKGTTLFTAPINECNVGYLNSSTIDISESVHLISMLPLNLSLWYKQLEHHNYDDLKLMIRENLVDGLVLDSKAKPDPICKLCLAGKMQTHSPHQTVGRQSCWN